ncbi:hypothetical protein T440DRAFT_475940 [Plenodomus tracheiphilus IPT5]|uniref:Uncharacterized protein n=1 Tax=Plenodomus tracheiphilus IPT5 TaxID=1408161 RepID=A0A6A7BH63_9PLEO|nr:hypothetical protein T440DRAFT_475940 [Plenodomus tracheiphilus IPT5]
MPRCPYKKGRRNPCVVAGDSTSANPFTKPTSCCSHHRAVCARAPRSPRNRRHQHARHHVTRAPSYCKHVLPIRWNRKVAPRRFNLTFVPNRFDAGACAGSPVSSALTDGQDNSSPCNGGGFTWSHQASSACAHGSRDTKRLREWHQIRGIEWQSQGVTV